jgi:hypothetical protein
VITLRDSFDFGQSDLKHWVQKQNPNRIVLKSFFFSYEGNFNLEKPDLSNPVQNASTGARKVSQTSGRETVNVNP